MKIRIPRRVVLSLESIFFFFGLFFVSSFALLENVSIPIPAFSLLKMPILYAGALCILTRIPLFLRVFRKKKYFFVLLVVVLFCAGLELSAYFNHGTRIGSDPQNTTIRLILYLVELFCIMIWAAESGRSRFVMDFLFYYVLILTVATDVLLTVDKYMFGYSAAGVYLLGSKFTVSYFHINLFALWLMRNRERIRSDRKARRIIYVGLPVILIVSLYVECLTGALSCLVFLALFLMMNTSMDKKIRMLNSRTAMICTLIFCVVFPFVVEGFVSIPFVTSLLEDFLNRSTTLSGRLDIYERFAYVMNGHWMWGYGFGNGNTVSMVKFGYANAQNALLHWILQTGVLTTGLLSSVVVTVIGRVKRSPNVDRCMPMVLLIYLYVVLGIIEITFSMSFLLWVAALFMITCSKNNPNQQHMKRK